MSALASLKLIAAKRPNQIPPVVQRRNKLVKRIFEQIEFAKAKQEGKPFVPTQLQYAVDEETGERKTIEIPKRVKEWWFITDAGKLCVSIKYGSKIVELGAKGKTAVELADGNDLVPTLETLKKAVENGELDTQIEAISGAVKATIKK